MCEATAAAPRHGAPTILYRPKQDVDEVFKMVKVDRLFTFAHSETELQQLTS